MMFYNYLLLGFFSISFSFIWFKKLRKIRIYGKKDQIDEFPNIDTGHFEKLENWTEPEHGSTSQYDISF